MFVAGRVADDIHGICTIAARWYVAAVLDVLLRGADVVDGTGSARRRADVGITDGRIVLPDGADTSTRRAPSMCAAS